MCIDTGQTDIFVKTIFSNSGGLKTSKFDENSESDFSHKTGTISYNKDVQTLLKIENSIFQPEYTKYEKNVRMQNCLLQ